MYECSKENLCAKIMHKKTIKNSDKAHLSRFADCNAAVGVGMLVRLLFLLRALLFLSVSVYVIL